MRRALVVLSLGIALLSSSLSAQEAVRTKDNYAACLEKEDFKTFIQMLSQKDHVAAAGMVADGSCLMLQPGVKWFVDDRTWTGLIRLRYPGTRVALWTQAEAVQ